MTYLNLLQSMKRNAPQIFNSYRDRKIHENETRIEELRGLYKHAKDNGNEEDMSRYEKTARELKKDIEVYRDIDAQTSIV